LRRLGLGTFVVGFIFWYGLSLLNPQATHLVYTYQIVFSLLLFFTIVVISHAIVYRRVGQALPNYCPPPGSRTLFNFVLIILVLHSILYVTDISGMAKYHLLRIISAFGIMAFILSFFFHGSARALLLLISVLIVFEMSQQYSRRLSLVIIAAALLYPLIVNRYNISKRALMIFCIGSLSFLSVVLASGSRAIRQGNSFSDYSFSSGLEILFSGSGFDTVHLLDFTIGFYDSATFLYGESLVAGLLNWVPRTLWPEKPIAFGAVLSGQYFGVNIENLFTNFGPGVVAEAYANGGWAGIMTCAVLLGLGIAYADRYIERNNRNFLGITFGVIFIPFVFFVIRGDFVNSFYQFYFKFAWVYISYKLHIIRAIRLPN
jgi:hypothetical protein